MPHTDEITDENQASRSFHASELNAGALEQIINHSSEAIFILDRNHRIRFANQAANDLLAQFSNTTADQALQTLLSPDPQSTDTEGNKSEMLGLIPPVFDLAGSSRLVVTSEKRIFLKIRSETLSRSDGAETILYLTDLTPQIEREVEFCHQRSFTLARQLSREVSHELNNALGAILMALEALDLSRSQDRELVQIVKDAADVLNFTTEKLRRFGKGKHPYTQEISTHSLIEIVHDALSSLVPSEQTLHYSRPQEIPSLVIDPNELGMILLALGLKAARQLGDQAQITLQVRTIDVTGSEQWGAASRIEPGSYLSIEFSGVSSAQTEPLEHAGTGPAGHCPVEALDLELSIYRSLLGDYNADLDEILGTDGIRRYSVFIPCASVAPPTPR